MSGLTFIFKLAESPSYYKAPSDFFFHFDQMSIKKTIYIPQNLPKFGIEIDNKLSLLQRLSINFLLERKLKNAFI